MGKYRMYEPYGYDEEGDYISKRYQIENDLQISRENDKKEFDDIDELYTKHNTEVFGSAYYDNDLESVIFKNVEGDAIGSLKMTDIFPSKLVKSAEYDKDTQQLIITFDNDDTIVIDLNDLINNLEAGDGLILNDGKFNVLIAQDSETFVSGSGESFLSVDSNGVKISHIQDAIDVEKERALEAERVERETRIQKDTEEHDARVAQDNVLLGLINTEKSRAMGEESRIETKLDNEIADRNTHNNEHDASIAALQATITSLQATISAQQATISSMQSAISNLDRRVTALENRF